MSRKTSRPATKHSAAYARELERLRAAFDLSGDAIFIFDGEGNIVEVNQVSCDRYGYARDELRGMHVSGIDAPEEVSEIPGRLEKIHRQGGAFFEAMHRAKDGRLIPTEVNSKRVRQGEDTFIISVNRDITERRKANETLRRREEQFATILRTAMDGFWVTDREGRFLEVNDSVCRTLGYKREELLDMSVADIEATQDQTEILRSIRRIVERGSDRFEGRHRCRDGSMREVEVSVNYLPSPHDCFFAFLRDITERKQAERRVADALAFIQTMIEKSPIGIVTVSASGDVVWVNETTARLVGGTVDQLKGQNVHRLDSWRQSGMLAAAEKALLTGAEQQLEASFKSTFGKEFRFSCLFVPFSFEGDPHLLSLFTDITEREKLEGQLRQAQKMEAVGQLAGGIAHDFNNLLTAVNGYSELILARLDKDSPLRKEVREIQRAGERAAALTRQLLAFSRRQALQPRVISMNSVVLDLLNMLRRLIGENIEVGTELAPDLGQVKVDPGQIEQVLMNLSVNARDAMPDGGLLRLGTRNAEVETAVSDGGYDVPPGRYVLLEVRDNGTGMDPVTLRHIFEPFFTTKEKGKGTGLGLATVYGIVKQSGGHITVDSGKARGTTFRIYLPRFDGAAEEGTSLSEHLIVGGKETLLVVEDEDLLRNLVRDVLRQEGYTVLEARDGMEALRVSGEYPGVIHLVVTDMVMPEMNGKELSERILSERKEVKLLFMSGYMTDSLTKGLPGEGIAFLQKPFSMHALTRKVREVLGMGPDTG
jgi:PAS domain S-box-containing protein